MIKEIKKCSKYCKKCLHVIELNTKIPTLLDHNTYHREIKWWLCNYHHKEASLPCDDWEDKKTEAIVYKDW